MTDQVDLSGEAPEADSPPPGRKYLTVREAAFIGVGSMVGAGIFALLGAAHFRVRSETGANPFILGLAIASAGVVLVVFVFSTLIHEPASIATLAGIIVLGVVLDFWWKRVRADRAKRVPVAS